MPSDNVRRGRSKSDLEPASTPADLHMTKRRKTITNFDASSHARSVEDRYGTYVKSAEVPITTILKAPPPIDTHTAITNEFVEHAINYASDRLNFRRVNTRTATILRRYLELAETVKATQDLLDKVRLQECHHTLHSEAFLLQETSKEDLERDQALRSLLTLRYYLEYGDYVAEYCKEFKDNAIAAQSKGGEYFTRGKVWSEVQEELQKEAESCKQWHREDRKGIVPRTPTTDAINAACANGDFDITQVKHSIKWYSDRTQQAHNGVGQMIQRCELDKLGERLYSDLESIPTVLGQDDQAMMEKVLESIRDRFFREVRPEDSVLSNHAIEMVVRKETEKSAKYDDSQSAKDKKQKADLKAAAKRTKRAGHSHESKSADGKWAASAGIGAGKVDIAESGPSGEGDHGNIVIGR